MEELSECMQKLEKIKRVVYQFKNDLCPDCNEKLEILDFVELKTNYKCKGCGLTFWENQFYETYFDVIIRVMDG